MVLILQYRTAISPDSFSEVEKGFIFEEEEAGWISAPTNLKKSRQNCTAGLSRAIYSIYSRFFYKKGSPQRLPVHQLPILLPKQAFHRPEGNTFHGNRVCSHIIVDRNIDIWPRALIQRHEECLPIVDLQVGHATTYKTG